MELRRYNQYLFAIVGISSLIIVYLFNTLIITKDVFYYSLGNQLTFERIEEIINNQSKYLWVGYLFIPVWLLLKTFMVNLTLQAGALLYGIKLKLSQTIKVALMAEFVFLIPQLLKLGWFLLIQKEYTLTDVQQFYPLSILSLFHAESLSAIWIYPFQIFNVFEALYWFVLAGGIKQVLDKDMDTGIKIVFSGYVPALMLWLIFIAFITISVTSTT